MAEEKMTNLTEQYKKAVHELKVASSLIDDTRGMKRIEAKIDYVMTQINLVEVQMLMIMQNMMAFPQPESKEAKEDGKEDGKEDREVKEE